MVSQIVTDIASNLRQNETSLFEFGRVFPPNLYKHSVLRKAKQKNKDQILGVKVKCPIKTLVELKYSQFATSIHPIGIDPLFHLFTIGQIIIWLFIKILLKNNV